MFKLDMCAHISIPTLLTNHTIKYLVVFHKKIKVIVDWFIWGNSRVAARKIPNADLLFILCYTFVQHILSEVYWWGGDNIST